jgi:hypothetical protein
MTDATATNGAFMNTATGTGSTGTAICNPGPNDDFDGDGWTIAQGDCNDCDPNINPDAIDVHNTVPDPMTGKIPPDVDDDCDGDIADVPKPCDTGLAIDSTDPMDAAKAIEMCKVSTGIRDWGVVSAKYVRANGNPYGAQEPLQHGILTSFGPNVKPKGGQSMLVLSSGRARLPGQPGAATSRNMTSLAGTPPPNFPENVPGCSGGTSINDDVALEVDLRAPSNAIGYTFDFKFYTFEYPQWICTNFNDQFVALVDPPPMGSVNGNISFDSMNHPVSVNIAFFNVCNSCANYALNCKAPSMCPMAPSPCCPSGDMELIGTGFDNSFGTGGEGGATTWLRTSAPIHRMDEFALRFAIWDTGDHNLDSTVLVDNFQWVAQGGSVQVGTMMIPM